MALISKHTIRNILICGGLRYFINCFAVYKAKSAKKQVSLNNMVRNQSHSLNTI